MRKKSYKWGSLIIGVMLGLVAPVATAVVPLIEVQAVTTADTSQPAKDNSISRLVTATSSAVDNEAPIPPSASTDTATTTADRTSASDQSSQATSASTASSSKATAVSSSRMPKSLAREAAATDDIASGSNGTVSWRLDSAGVLHLSGGSLAVTGTSSVSPWPLTAVDSISIEGDITVDTLTSYTYLFANLANLTNIEGLDKLKMAGVTSTAYMFYGDKKLQSIDFGENDFSSVQSMASMFSQCKVVATINTQNWDVRQVKNMSQLFSGDAVLRTLDFSGWQTSSVTNINMMFWNCDWLLTLDLSGFDTSKVTQMAYTFAGCTNLQKFNITGWQTGNVTNFTRTFYGCIYLSNLDVANWDVSKATTLSETFSLCTHLTSLDVSKWDTSRVTDFYSTFYQLGQGNPQVLDGGTLDTLDVGKWDTSAGTDFRRTFYQCGLQTLDLTNWDTSAATSRFNMFSGASDLKHLTLGSKFSFHGDTQMALNPIKIGTYDSYSYTGKWQFGTDGQTYTADELMTTYDGATMAGQYNWERKSGTITTKYLDTAKNVLAPETTQTGLVGDSYTTKALDIDGYELTETPTNATGTYPRVNRTNADPSIVTYIYQAGSLAFGSVPTVIDFGTHKLASHATYGATPDQPLTVQDNRRLASAWTLTAQLGSGGFVDDSDATKPKYLGATLRYRTGDQNTIIGQAATPIVTHTTTSHDPVELSSGWSDTAGLMLTAPENGLVGHYHATITWNLGATVANQ
ncbi:BspA family leucine-rich repeat surface protein [Lactobacillus sp. CBA3606]|uniref:BspA family leucine-rich repeat surface protein n=1 Tax=Lactobacillus sp. CBA3606 TaxID=2099789 RepID=UPI001319EF62|nr:BspA family leucine-rich repeat surface protein [Lactobacillus sp. CBA3606]